jgi:hypothetical protein
MRRVKTRFIFLCKQKLKNMTYRIFVSDDRVEFLVNELGDKAKVLDKKEGMTTIPVEITIEDSMDILNVFHAGIRTGMKVFQQ